VNDGLAFRDVPEKRKEQAGRAEAFFCLDVIHLLFVFNGVHELATLRFWLLLDQAKIAIAIMSTYKNKQLANN